MTDEPLDPERLRRLQDAVAALPRTVEPVRDAWPAIRERIEAQRVRAIAPRRADAPARRPNRVVWFAAAAIVLVTLSSATTILVLRGRATPPLASRPVAAPPAVAAVAAAPDAGVEPSATRALPPRVVPAAGGSLSLVFTRYDAAAADLTAELDARRVRLDPRTLAVLDSCIRRIDAAIAEARSALREDPRNAVVTELLTVSYRQKLDLLKRAADLPLGSLQD